MIVKLAKINLRIILVVNEVTGQHCSPLTVHPYRKASP